MCDKGQRGGEELGSMATASYSFSVSSGSTEARLLLDSEKEGGGGRQVQVHVCHRTQAKTQLISFHLLETGSLLFMSCNDSRVAAP